MKYEVFIQMVGASFTIKVATVDEANAIHDQLKMEMSFESPRALSITGGNRRFTIRVDQVLYAQTKVGQDHDRY